MAAKTQIAAPEKVEGLIHLLRGQKVMFDFDLAALYGVETRVLNQAVKRNRVRFPDDFMFQLSEEEMNVVTQARVPIDAHKNSSQFVMSSDPDPKARSSSSNHRGSAYRYYAFTEQGVAMLSGVLRSPRAVRVNIEIMRAFIRLRQWLASNAELTRRLNDLEKKYDGQFKAVFQAIRELMDQRAVVAATQKREIGFHAIRGPGKTQARTKFKNCEARTGHKL